MTYHSYFFVGKFPKFFNFSDSMEKIYLVELNIFKENAIYGLQENLLDNFLLNFYIWSAIVNGACMQNFELEANIFCRFYFQFARFYARFNFRCANFESFSWRVCLRARVRLKTLSSLPKAGVHLNLSEILVSLKRGWKGNKGLWDTTRQLPDHTMAPQVVGQLFGAYLPIFNSKF